MKQYFILIVMLVLSIGHMRAQWKAAWFEEHSRVFLDVDYTDSIPVYDKPEGKIIKYVKNNMAEEDGLYFEILESNGKMFHVNVTTTKFETFVVSGWVNIKDSHLGIYSRAYNGILYFYKYPGNKKVINYILRKYNPEMYTVIDCKGNWLKVKSKIDGILYVGWIEPIMQCCNIYSTCS